MRTARPATAASGWAPNSGTSPPRTSSHSTPTSPTEAGATVRSGSSSRRTTQVKLREYLVGLTAPPGQPEPEPTVIQEITEAAAEMLDVLLPGIEAIAGVRKHCLEMGLNEQATDEIVMAIVRRYVEQM